MAINDTKICNMALDKLGAANIVDLDTDKSPQGQKCRIHFEQTRDALIRSHYWRFASARASLSKDTVDPDFEYDSQFILPTDFMRFKSLYLNDRRPSLTTRITVAIEGDRLLTNETAINMRYIKRVTDPTKFDELFTEVFILKLALKLVALAGANPKMTQTLGGELARVMPSVRALDRQETNNIGRDAHVPWTEVRVSARSATIGDTVNG
jgi:hypothetical protein